MDTSNIDVALDLDVRGHKCPIPMARLGVEINSVEVGEVIKLVATDPACMLDVPAWARLTENEILSAEEVAEGEFVIFVLRKK